MKKFIKIYILTILALTGVSLSSCTEEPLVAGGESVIEGEPATVGLRVTVDDMSILSRAGENDHNVESLWIAIYNVSSGRCTFKGAVSENNTEAEDTDYTLDNIKCESGKSYIVGVANYTGVTAVTLENKDKERPLAELLDEADTWDKFRSIIYRRVMIDDTDISVTMPSFGMPMSGSYRASKAHDHNDAIDAVEIKPGTNNTLSGMIHLRRILARNTLNIQKGGDVIDLEVLDIEVFNLPKYTWMHSRSSKDVTENPIDFANAGDAMDPDGQAVDNPHYVTSLRYTPPAEITLKEGVYSFDFYQFENKRTGKAQNYYEREKEIKDNNLNTGRYESLVSVSELNNNATYVKIKARVTYKNPSGNLQNPDEIEVGNGGLPNSAASRTAEVTYVVHLGYIKTADKSDGDPTDFNCRRNAHYTYNIKVETVNKIIVEAFINEEDQPGAEGTVTDVTDKMFDLDAHFGVFNMKLTKKEIDGFTFTMRTYDNGAPQEVYYLTDGSNNLPQQGDPMWKYYDWVEVLPTTGENDIAVYPGYGSKEIMYLGDLHNYKSDKLATDTDEQWFTVYVNEYSYEERDPNSGNWGKESTNWKNYVNQPNRQAWFNVAMYESKDNESTYFQSKYALTQKSIQTYYDITPKSCTTALGLEHTNESFGMNLRWLNASDYNNSVDNGRYNVYNSMNNSEDTDKFNWDTYLNRGSFQDINEITNKDQIKNANISTDTRRYYVMMQNLIQRSTLNSDTGAQGMLDGQASSLDPQTNHSNAQYIEGMYACMNRNRDENGNGIIDNEELKWYVPATGKYLRMIIGRNSLATPLMNYAQPTLAGACGDDNNTMYHYFASDKKKVWVDEGMSSSFFKHSDWSHMPWNVRCIRNLGTDLTTIDPTDKVSPAYDGTDFDEKTMGGVVKVTHYYGTVLRDPVISPIELHKTSDPKNKIAQYGFEIAPQGNYYPYSSNRSDKLSTIEISHNNGQISNATYTTISNFVKSPSDCTRLNNQTGRNGWRLPNQKEIVIMMRMGILEGGRYLTCTQEHWTNFGDNPGNSSEALNKNYRMTTVHVDDKIALSNWQSIEYIRCVRDLTAAEASKSYQSILTYKTN